MEPNRNLHLTQGNINALGLQVENSALIKRDACILSLRLMLFFPIVPVQIRYVHTYNPKKINTCIQIEAYIFSSIGLSNTKCQI